jgi:hypothetical protein
MELWIGHVVVKVITEEVAKICLLTPSLVKWLSFSY